MGAIWHSGDRVLMSLQSGEARKGYVTGAWSASKWISVEDDEGGLHFVDGKQLTRISEDWEV